MPTCCVIIHCPNGSAKRLKKGVSVHRFPNNETNQKYRNLWERWTSMINQSKFVATDHSALCTDHFDKKYYKMPNGRRLYKFAVPTLWLGEEKPLQEQVVSFDCIPGTNYKLVKTLEVCRCPCFCGIRTPNDENQDPKPAEKVDVERARTPPNSDCEIVQILPNAIEPAAEKTIDLELSVTGTCTQPNSDKTSPSTSVKSKGDQCKTSIKPRRQRRAFVGDLTPSCFATPHQRKVCCDMIKDYVAKTSKKLYSETGKVKRLQAKIKTLNDVIAHLKKDQKEEKRVKNDQMD